MNEKIKYWWSEDRQFFCILVNDGISQATVSLSIEETDALMGEVMQTPSFLKLQEDAWQQALRLMDAPVRCEMCADSKWKNACPECDGAGRVTPQ